ncbi:MAG: DUF2802 domain-containing protein [Gammaproteobacteria bacterium]|nr:DUF2802 domain-containing protein [Gammaproteobacteria bacterium]MCW8988705.1 DUF2802 domain-containing protein [Gammaproteobacteria bacterium]MCW9030223.1 DUF2802 domain-containing protein [Gammaproteobacteria bacterium]
MELLTQYLNILSATEWLLASVAVILVMSLFSFRRQRKLQQEQTVSMQALQRDLRALANAAVGVGGRVLEIERQQRKRPAAINVQEPVQAQVSAPIEFYNPSSHPYEQAIRMVQTGASVDDIVTVCGLSKSEAELVSMMHRLDKAS